MSLLAHNGGWFTVRHPRHGTHVEADLSRRVLVLARGRRFERIYHTPTGAPATPTVRGSSRFTARSGANAKEMFHPRYFIRGFAIHGFGSVPMVDPRSIEDWIELGDRIDVYR